MRRVLVAAIVVAVLAAGSAGLLALSQSSGADTEPDNTEATTDTRSTATVSVGDLAEERSFDGDITYGETWTIKTATSGTVTSAPATGDVVEFGQELLRTDDNPLYLAKGEMPMYRELSKQEGDDRLKGPDVSQLQEFLLDQGYDAGGTLKADGVFGPRTEKALKAWQEATGLEETGTIDDKQLVFSLSPVRLAADIRVGSSFESLTVSNANPTVTVQTNNADRRALVIGTEVTVIAGETKLSGTVSAQEATKDDEGKSVWDTSIVLDDAPPSQATTVQVVVTQNLAENVKLVPVSALLALAEGGYAVELVEGDTTRLVRVDLGEVLNGRAEISSDELSEGDEVVIPS